MRRRFVAKRRMKFGGVKIILYLLIAILSFYIALSIFIKSKTGDTYKEEQLFSIGTNSIRFNNFNLLSFESLFKIGLGYDLKKKESVHFNDDLISIDTDSNDDRPLVYIYNTHDTESYDKTLFSAYNITFNVKTASYILREYLQDYGIPTYVEPESMSSYIREHELLYRNSYDASRYYIDKRLKEYDSIDFLIDLHRDAVPKQESTTTIDDKNYAKVMFVVGLDHENYTKNLDLAELLNSKLDSRLSRGVNKKNGPKVNGVYNQDVSPNAILIEVGGLENTIDEVNNTLKEIAKIIYEYLKG